MGNETRDQAVQLHAVARENGVGLDDVHRSLSHAQIEAVLDMIGAAGWPITAGDSEGPPPVPCSDCPTMEWVRTAAQQDVDRAQGQRDRLQRRVQDLVLDRQTAWQESERLRDRLAAVEAERDGLLVERRGRQAPEADR
jgi:hypothetical protein